MATSFTRPETARPAALFFAALTVTMLGYRNPARRLAGAVRGLLRPPRGSASRRPIAVIGHRGAAREAPENTLVSFAKAVDLGADAIETDVCVTRDGRFVGILTDDARLLRRTVSERNPAE